MGRLDGKVVILTGASAGIGKQTAIRFAEEGAKLAICARRENLLKETAKLCEEAGGEVLAQVCDVTKFEDLESLVKNTMERFGRIDVLINNAISVTLQHPFIEFTRDELDLTWESGFVAAWHLMQLCYPYFKQQGEGNIINISSTAGIMGLEGFAAYAATKEALRGISRVAAHEWGPDNIRVNVLNPSAVTESIEKIKDTQPEAYQQIVDMMASFAALKRVGDAYTDVVPALIFLASDDSRYMTGQTMNVEGGGVMNP